MATIIEEVAPLRVRRSKVLTITPAPELGSREAIYFLSCGHEFVGRKMVRCKSGGWRHPATVKCGVCYPSAPVLPFDNAADFALWLDMRVWFAQAEIAALADAAADRINTKFDKLIESFCPDRVSARSIDS